MTRSQLRDTTTPACVHEPMAFRCRTPYALLIFVVLYANAASYVLLGIAVPDALQSQSTWTIVGMIGLSVLILVPSFLFTCGVVWGWYCSYREVLFVNNECVELRRGAKKILHIDICDLTDVETVEFSKSQSDTLHFHFREACSQLYGRAYNEFGRREFKVPLEQIAAAIRVRIRLQSVKAS